MKDKILSNLLKNELQRQKDTLNLIPSENYVSSDILSILGSPLTNKYSEGYPGKRYYPGNQFYDEIERLAQNRALKFFGLKPTEWRANVQPYSGSPANLAIYSALLEKDDVILSLRLDAGGHLSHGHKVSASGKFFKVVHYGVGDDGLVDYERLAELARESNAKIIVSGFTAYPRKVDFSKIGKIATSVGAYHLADISHIAGLVGAGLHPSPFAHSDVVMTTTHKTLRGPRGAVIFSRSELADRIDRAVFPGMQGGPHNNVIAAKALMFFEDSTSAFKKYQQQIVKNATVLAKGLTGKGFDLLTGGTDTHLMLINLKPVGLTGMEAEKILEKNNINANRNSLPGDPSPFNPTGIRIGIPAATTRGMKEKEMAKVAELIHRALVKKENVLKEVVALCKKFPLPY
ncbi:MAG: glycine hydroxymethyltransferase [Parcubacteria group bacterium Gr01-1014_19]|nr:MAG: glycine hydroxymethyltransferase [Parcubacteria group bacterium Gr01-1014_19]